VGSCNFFSDIVRKVSFYIFFVVVFSDVVLDGIKSVVKGFRSVMVETTDGYREFDTVTLAYFKNRVVFDVAPD
jgi:hypothetical protein